MIDDISIEVKGSLYKTYIKNGPSSVFYFCTTAGMFLLDPHHNPHEDGSWGTTGWPSVEELDYYITKQHGGELRKITKLQFRLETGQTIEESFVVRPNRDRSKKER